MKGQKKINEKPFELVGMTYADYVQWCKDNSKKVRDPKSKKLFFNAIYGYKLIKKDGKLIDLTKEAK